MGGVEVVRSELRGEYCFLFFLFWKRVFFLGRKTKISRFHIFSSTKQARPLRRWLEKNVITALSKKLISGEVEEGDLVEVGVSPEAAAKAERKQKSKAGTSDDEEGWVSVEEEGDSGLVYTVKKGKGPPVAGSPDASSKNAPAPSKKRSEMETAPSEALTETEEEMEDERESF